jgi:hypothetical protein
MTGGFRYGEVAWVSQPEIPILFSGYTEGGSSTVPLTSCLTGLDKSVLEIKTINVSCHTADSKPAKQEVNSTVILPPLVFPVILLEVKSY